MNPTSLRRLVTEHRALHASPLPPNYLFPTTTSGGSTPEDLTQLSVLLAGPEGTPYSDGLWRVHLKMPEDYPRSAPKAAFRTKIWHPNVEESTGSVCVDTLKRDWSSDLSMRDVLVTISCLLIHPNPDSALNSAAGHLLQEDYEAFARQAKLMTSIHAMVPQNLREAVMQAKRRGEEEPAKGKNPEVKKPAGSQRQISLPQRPLSTSQNREEEETQLSDDDDDDDEATASKENDPSLSPSPVSAFPPSPRKSGLKKRPLSTLPTPIDPDKLCDEDGGLGISASDRNIANNNYNSKPSRMDNDGETTSRGSRKSPKLSEAAKGVNASGRIRDDDVDDCTAIFAPSSDDMAIVAPQAPQLGPTAVPVYPDGKENMSGEKDLPPSNISKPATDRVTSLGGAAASSSAASSRKTSGASQSSGGKSSGKNGKARVGLRRL
ncbi:MAG: hypothetical protein M1816_005045 [Peltula sp. TS41687]|nr:MAG: hypothetical protein M1816_005045 [Peltula sp. TS41687]